MTLTWLFTVYLLILICLLKKSALAELKVEAEKSVLGGSASPATLPPISTQIGVMALRSKVAQGLNLT